MIITARASVSHRVLVTVDVGDDDYTGHTMTLYREDSSGKVPVRGMVDVPVESTVVPDNEAGLNRPVRYVLEATGVTDTVYRTNLAPNPSWELATSPAVVGGNAELTLDEGWFVSGSASLKITPNGTQLGSAAYPFGPIDGTSARLGLVPGRTYTLSATIRLTEPQPDEPASYMRRIAVGLRSAAGDEYEWMVSDAAPNSAGETRLSVTFTMPAEGNLFFRLMNGSATVPVWWDGVLLEEDGGDWTPETVLRTNRSLNPRNAAGGWRATSTTSHQVEASALPSSPPGTSIVTGAKSTRLIDTQVAANVFDCDGFGTSSSTPARRMGVWVYPVAVADCEARIGNTGTYVDTPPDQWTWVVATVPLGGTPGGMVQVSRKPGTGNAAIGTAVHVTGSVINYAAAPINFFDGDTAQNGDRRYRWTGTPGASISEEYVPSQPPEYFDGDTGNSADGTGILYRWTGTEHQSASEQYTSTGDLRWVTDPVTLTADYPVLSHPVTGEQVQLTIVDWPELSYDNGRKVMRIPRRRSPVVMTGIEYMPTSSPELMTKTAAEMRRFRALVEPGDALLLRPSCPGIEDAYMSLATRTEARMTVRAADQVRIHEMDADHVEAPDMHLRGRGDTLGDLHQAVPTTLADIHARWPGRLFDIADADLKANG